MHHNAAMAPPRNRRFIFLSGLILAAILFLLQALYWQGHIRHDYSPTGDEFSLLTHSARMFQPHPSEWFTRGFADYFKPFPDLAVPYSEFLRPADNALYYGNSLLFGRSWSAYLLANYLVAALLCAVVFSLAAGTLRLPALIVFLVTCGTIASPAYTYHVLYRPSFAFDYLGALCALSCVLCLTRNRLAPAWLFALLAVLSKETAYYTPVAACAAVALFDLGKRPRARWLRSALFLLPLAFVLLLRQLDFHRASGVYVASHLTPRTLLHNILIGLTDWPYRLPGEQHIFERSAANLGSLLLSAFLWLLIGVALLALFRAFRSTPEAPRSETQASLGILLLFLLGSCGLPIALGLGPRFGASAFPLLLLTLGLLAANTMSFRWTRPVALSCLGLITLANVWNLTHTFSEKTLQHERTGWALSRDLLNHLRGDHHSTRFLLTDATESFSSASSLQRFLGSSEEVLPVVDIAASACASKPVLHVDTQPSRFSLDETLPSGCGSYDLYATGRQPGDPGTYLTRSLPQAQITYRSPAPSVDLDAYSWTTVHIELLPRVPSYVVYLADVNAGTYRVIGSSDKDTGTAAGSQESHAGISPQPGSSRDTLNK